MVHSLQENRHQQTITGLKFTVFLVMSITGCFRVSHGHQAQGTLEAAGGVKGKLKGVIVGGLSVAILTGSEAEGLVLDYESCQKAGTALGSGGIIVVNQTVSIPELALRTIEFYHHESCGQCVPCREGSHVIAQKLRALLDGKGSMSDIDLILYLCENIKGLTLCPTGEAFSVPIQAMIRSSGRNSKPGKEIEYLKENPL